MASRRSNLHRPVGDADPTRKSIPRRRPDSVVSIGDLHPEFDRDDFDEAELPVLLEEMKNLQLKLEKDHKFREAEVVRLKLEKLKLKEQSRRQDESQSQHIAVRLGIETAHMQELQEFNDVWDAKDAEFEMHVKALHEELERIQKTNLARYLEKVQDETEPRQPKWSKELLNQRRIQDILAKQKNYIEAAKVKDEIDTITKKENAKWFALREAKIAALEEQFKQKQQSEMSGLMARINRDRRLHNQARKKELERLLQRYHNVKTQMETQQKIKTQNKYKEVDCETSSRCSRVSIGGRRTPGGTARSSMKVESGVGSIGRSASAPGSGQQRRPGTTSAGQVYDPPRRGTRNTVDWR